MCISVSAPDPLLPIDAPIGDIERFPTVARSSSTLALIGAAPLLRGLISTRIFLSLSSSEQMNISYKQMDSSNRVTKMTMCFIQKGLNIL